jgi:hypothetical protein
MERKKVEVLVLIIRMDDKKERSGDELPANIPDRTWKAILDEKGERGR